MEWIRSRDFWGLRAMPFTTDKPPAAPDAENGRGLHLVRACAGAMGVSVLRHLGASKGGKLLWAECGSGPTGTGS
ncbi:hypothetical protein [Streptomyces sp. NPDC050759]|uniref:hypothetical protein n=1 Tax=Streptomyces sp. NPDC050759 TaxID=3365635 RepID=UPI0037B2F5F9